ncbi:energy transducer TonB [Gallaecimonas kandeliae]|uniref:energy transducer TonB n=1 Tax=Gallaecimonas kandeliae TaxID=3029055 RepID=UPI002647BC54|nr:energy transducer TonB [Gallaecimonas kandeliae]WKE64085.1 energy transducer TonB [Gallaecimonas kandeliae]
MMLLLSMLTSVQLFGKVQVSYPQTPAPWVRSEQTEPTYPLPLAKAGIRGCALFNVNIDKDGNTDKVQLVDAIPSRGLEKPAAQLIKGWHWIPSKEGKAQAASQQVRLDFCIDSQSEGKAKAQCLAQSQLKCHSGS